MKKTKKLNSRLSCPTWLVHGEGTNLYLCGKGTWCTSHGSKNEKKKWGREGVKSLAAVNVVSSFRGLLSAIWAAPFKAKGVQGFFWHWLWCKGVASVSLSLNLDVKLLNVVCPFQKINFNICRMPAGLLLHAYHHRWRLQAAETLRFQ